MSIEYIIKFDSEGEPVPCECCGMVAPVYLFRHSRDNPKNACEFCSTTKVLQWLLHQLPL